MAGVTTNPSNAMQKQDKGVMPDPLMSALNAAITQLLGGTSYNGDPMAESVAPPRVMPGGMQVQVAPQPPMPEPNPMFHAQSPIEYDMSSLFRQAMQGAPAPMPVPPELMAMGDEADLPPPPMPARKPALPKKPERTKRTGNEPKDEPRRVTPPPKPKGRQRMIAGK